MSGCRVLSIQSHVVCGYVGNRAATFPLQVLGCEVECINSVQLSNHTQYRYFQGQVLHCDELKHIFEGLKLNNIHHYSHLLTGYCGSPSFLEEVSNVLKELKKVNPSLVFVCDPVMGDNGRFYVPKDLLPIYQKELLPLADIITPNQFEAELLSGVTIQSQDDAIKAMEKLHDMGVKTVVLSSSELKDGDYLVLLASSGDASNRKRIRLEFPKINAKFTGTGDLFTCLILAWLSKCPGDLTSACEKTISTLQAVLHRTQQCGLEAAGPGNEPTQQQMELKLIQSIHDIMNPPETFTGKVVDL